jgi:hypothetical protein
MKERNYERKKERKIDDKEKKQIKPPNQHHRTFYKGILFHMHDQIKNLKAPTFGNSPVLTNFKTSACAAVFP